jgi:bifunctional ADP-heptose synthase (sugar kinase/adenylyltransferase)
LTKDASIMAQLANLAGGLVCEQVGTSPIDRARLEQESSKLGWC